MFSKGLRVPNQQKSANTEHKEERKVSCEYVGLARDLQHLNNGHSGLFPKISYLVISVTGNPGYRYELNPNLAGNGRVLGAPAFGALCAQRGIPYKDKSLKSLQDHDFRLEEIQMRASTPELQLKFDAF